MDWVRESRKQITTWLLHFTHNHDGNLPERYGGNKYFGPNHSFTNHTTDNGLELSES